MADHPMPFSAPMIRAILDGSKTQTRRALKFQPAAGVSVIRKTIRPFNAEPYHSFERRSLYGNYAGELDIKIQTGDRLWVRESYFQRGNWQPVEGAKTTGGLQKWAFVPADHSVVFAAPVGAECRLGRHHKDPATVAWHKRLGRFMPRAYSRLTLVVTDVRVERLQDISKADALAEGIAPHPSGLGYWVPGIEHPDPNFPWLSRTTPREMYAALWDTINGSGAWGENPWVVAYTFRVVHANIDKIGGGHV